MRHRRVGLQRSISLGGGGEGVGVPQRRRQVVQHLGRCLAVMEA